MGRSGGKRKRSVPSYPREHPPPGLSEDLHKYWRQRYQIFSRFDEGIRLDPVGWYSVTHQRIAEHTAARCECDVIVDGFCGVGGNAIQFARVCRHVIAIDISPERIACARHNAEVYGVSHKIDFICGDFFDVMKSLRVHADVVFLAPPWGGPEYKYIESFKISMLSPDGTLIFKAASRVTQNIACCLPAKTDVLELCNLSPVGLCEVEEVVMRSKVQCINVYYGGLVMLPQPST